MLRHAQRFVPVMVLGSLVLAVPTGAATRAPLSAHALRPFTRLAPSHVRPNSESVLYSFQGGISDGSLPYAGLVADKTVAGTFYGATVHGGSSAGAGTVFKLTCAGSVCAESVLYAFQGGADGAYPFGGVIATNAGTLYGTTYAGPSTVFKLRRTHAGTYVKTVLYTFGSQGPGDGASPTSPLYRDSTGALYGTTQNGGTAGLGTVFKLTPAGLGYTERVLYSFQGSGDGAQPWSGLIADAAGGLYGTTENGGQRNLGTVFKLTPTGSTYTESVLYSFQGAVVVPNDGAHPFAGLIANKSGTLFGTTMSGGNANTGTVFRLVPTKTGYTEKVIYAFQGFSSSDGAQPEAGLYKDASGTLYGTTLGGGTAGLGTVFKITPAPAYVESVLYSFLGSDGKNPQAPLMEQSGLLYGTTFYGGASGNGTVFALSP